MRNLEKAEMQRARTNPLDKKASSRRTGASAGAGASDREEAAVPTLMSSTPAATAPGTRVTRVSDWEVPGNSARRRPNLGVLLMAVLCGHLIVIIHPKYGRCMAGARPALIWQFCAAASS